MGAGGGHSGPRVRREADAEGWPSPWLRRLRLLREARGLRQADVAAVFGFTEGGYRQWEAGRVEVPGSAFPILARAFGLPLSAFLAEVFADELAAEGMPAATAEALEALDAAAEAIDAARGRLGRRGEGDTRPRAL